MNKYDAIIILGSQPNVKNWLFPKQIYDCLDEASRLVKKGAAQKIIVSGKRAIALDYRGIKQPYRECDKMAEYLMSQGVLKNQILKEGRSKDTISNLYYVKRHILIPRKIGKILFIVAEFRIRRLKFLCQKILGPKYAISFKGVPSPINKSYNEDHTFKVQSLFLEMMKNGDHEWLRNKFYSAWMYRYWRERSKEKYG